MNKPDLKKIKNIVIAAFVAATFAGNAFNYARGNINREISVTQPQQIPQYTEKILPATENIEEEVPEKSDNTGKIDLNTADINLLQTIPGIGPSKAQSILDYRSAYGSFVSIEEITEVKGIGDSTYNKIKDYIYVSTE